MATPPGVSREDADKAVERITERRRKIDDPNLDRLTDNPADMPGYLRRYTTSATPDWVKQADAEDGAIVRLYLWWDLESFELWCLDQHHEAGGRARRIGAVLGIRSRQGVFDRRDRVRTKLGYLGRPDEKHARAERSAERTRTAEGDRGANWLDEHRNDLDEVVHILIEHRTLAKDDDTYGAILDLARDRRGGTFTGLTMWSLDQAVEGLQHEPEIKQLPRDHPMRDAITRAEDLVQHYTTQAI